MTRQKLEFDVTARDVNAARTLDGVAAAADKAEEKLDGLGKTTQKVDGDLDGVATAADKAGKKLIEASAGARKLDEEIAAAGQQLKLLKTQFSDTGDLAILKKITSLQGKETRLSKQRDQIFGTAADAAAAGVKAGESFLGGLASQIGALPPQAQAAIGIGLIAAVAAVAPLAGATLAAGITAGVGAGGLAAGISLAFRDPAVTAAGVSFGERLKVVFTAAAEPLRGPVINALAALGDSATVIAGGAREVFATLAPEVSSLAHGVGQLGTHLMPGFKAASAAAVPILRMLAESAPKVGDAISEMLSDLSKDPDGAVLALRTLLDLTETAFRATGRTVKYLSDTFEWLVRTSVGVGDALGTVYGWVPIVGDHLKETTAKHKEWLAELDRTAPVVAGTVDPVRELADALERSSKEAHAAADGLDALYNTGMDVQRATIGAKDAIAGLTTAAKEHGRSLSLNSEKGRENRLVVLDAIDAATRAGEAERKRALAMSATPDAAAAAGARMRETWLKDLESTAKAAGFNAAEIAKMLAEARAADNTHIKIYIDQTYRVHGRKVTSGNEFSSGIGGYAEGGLVTGPGTGTSDDIVTKVSNGEYVVSAAATSRMGVAALDAINAGGNFAAAPAYGASAAAGRPGGDWAPGAIEAAMVRALRTVPIVQLSDAGATADRYYRGG